MAHKALLLDDDFRLRRLVQEALEHAGLGIAQNIAEANVIVAHAAKPLLRYEIDTRFLEEAVRLQRQRRIPIIGYTELGADFLGDRISRLRSACDRLVLGPMRPDEVAAYALRLGTHPEPQGRPPRRAPAQSGRRPRR